MILAVFGVFPAVHTYTYFDFLHSHTLFLPSTHFIRSDSEFPLRSNLLQFSEFLASLVIVMMIVSIMKEQRHFFSYSLVEDMNIRVYRVLLCVLLPPLVMSI